MRKSTVWAVAGCFLALVMVTAVNAASDATGPLKFSVTVSANPTDNRDSTPDSIKESNTDIYVSPKVDAIFDWGDSLLDFYYIPSYRYRTDAGKYQDTSKLLHDLGINGRYDLSERVSVRMKEHFKYTDDPTLASGGVTVTRDGVYFINNLGAGASVDITPESRMDIDAMWHTKDYDESVFKYLEEDSIDGTLAIRHSLSHDVVAVIEAKGSKFDYGAVNTLDDTTPVNNSDRDFSKLEGGVGLENQFRKDCKLSVYAGYTYLTFDEDKMDSIDAPYASVILDHNVNKTTRLSASARYGLRNTDIRTYAAQAYSDVRADLAVDVSDSVTIGAGGIYRYSDYDKDYLTPAGEAYFASLNRDTSGTEKTSIGYASVSYKLTVDSVVSMLYRYTKDDSDVSNDFDKNEGIISFTQHF